MCPFLSFLLHVPYSSVIQTQNPFPIPSISPPPSISEHLLHIWSSDEDSKLDESFSLSFVIPQAFCLSLESYLVQTCRKYIELFASRTVYILLNLIGIFLLIKKYRKWRIPAFLSAVSDAFNNVLMCKFKWVTILEPFFLRFEGFLPRWTQHQFKRTSMQLQENMTTNVTMHFQPQ